MNYIRQSTSLAVRWTVGSTIQCLWFPTRCWLQAHPSCRLGGFVLPVTAHPDCTNEKRQRVAGKHRAWADTGTYCGHWGLQEG